MPRIVLLLSALAVSLVVAVSHAAPPADDPLAQLKPGASEEDVRRLLGPPKTISRQILYGRFVEQWTYEKVRVEFDWKKGRPKQIQTVQKLTAD